MAETLSLESLSLEGGDALPSFPLHRIIEPLVTSIEYKYIPELDSFPCVLLAPDAPSPTVVVDDRAGVSFFSPHDAYSKYVHKHFLKRGSCHVTACGRPVPEGLSLVQDRFLCLNYTKQKTIMGHHISVRPTRSMPLADFEGKLVELFDITPCEFRAEGEEAEADAPPPPGYTHDDLLRHGCVALEMMYGDQSTPPGTALRAWALHHHLDAGVAGMGEIRSLPVPALELLATAMGRTPAPRNPFTRSERNLLMSELADALGGAYTPTYYGLSDDEEEAEADVSYLPPMSPFSRHPS